MAQGYRPTREAMRVMLSERTDGRFLIRVSCCAPRYYDPADLIQLFGDMPVLALQERMYRCEECGSRDFMRVRIVSPTGAERAKLKVRRLVDVKVVKRPVWRWE